jgi:hypothetical protein
LKSDKVVCHDFCQIFRINLNNNPIGGDGYVEIHFTSLGWGI